MAIPLFEDLSFNDWWFRSNITEAEKNMRKILNFCLRTLPKAIIYLFCARLFFTNVIKLCEEYLEFETNVLIEYYTPVDVKFPAITVCGCCLQDPIHLDKSVEKIFEEEYILLRNYSAMDIFDQFTYLPGKLLIGFTLTINGGGLEPNEKIKIPINRVALESIMQGRKCFTYLSTLPDYVMSVNHSTGKNIKSEMIVKADISIRMDVFSNYTKELVESDIFFGIHPTNAYPSFLESDFIRLYSETIYAVKFERFITHLMESPYVTKCSRHDPLKRPRSQSECINMCILKETFDEQRANNRTICINYYNFITRRMIMDYPGVRFCQNRNYLEYYRHVLARRKCYSKCKRNCLEDDYFKIFDIGQANDGLTQITMEANHEPVYRIHHEKMMTFFETIGYFGGHAHFWLGLSVIQFYDVFEKLFLTIRYHCERLVRFVAGKKHNQIHLCA